MSAGTFIFKVVKILVFWTLHIALAVLSIVLAVVLGTIYWLIWMVHLPFRRPQPEVKMPDVPDISSQVSLDVLLGPGALRKIDAVFEGGGVKALAQIGAIQAIEQLQLEWSLLGGTSGGAIMASILAAGKDSREVWQLLAGVGLHNMVDVWYLPRVAFLQKKLYFYAPMLANLVFTKGMVSGDVFLKTMRRILEKDGQELRFKDLVNPDWQPGGDAPRYVLKMVATDISRGIPIVIPDDLSAYWESWDQARKLPPDSINPSNKEDAQDWWPVAEAVRMSMSIPFFFKPVKLHLNVEADGKTVKHNAKGQKGQPVLIVDGGVSSNFPIWLFDRLHETPRWPTFGFLLDESKGTPAQHARVTGLIIDLAASVIFTGMGAMDKRLSKHDEYRTAKLGTRLQTEGKTKQVGTTDFGLSLKEQKALVASGLDDTVNFLKRFEWNYYISRFRR